jgi:hypothetical protein
MGHYGGIVLFTLLRMNLLREFLQNSRMYICTLIEKSGPQLMQSVAPENILIEIKQEDHLKHFNRVDGVAV